MTENATLGNMDKATILDRSEGGCWSLWKKIAKKDVSFGKPEVFCGNIDKTTWESYTITAKGPKMRKLMERFADQPDDVIIVWAYALFPSNEGDFIKKKMSDCTGCELLQELLYHLGIDEKEFSNWVGWFVFYFNNLCF